MFQCVYPKFCRKKFKNGISVEKAGLADELFGAAIRAIHGLHSQLWSHSRRTSTKVTLYRTMIIPVALYGHDVLTLKKTDQRVLGVFLRQTCR